MAHICSSQTLTQRHHQRPRFQGKIASVLRALSTKLQILTCPQNQIHPLYVRISTTIAYASYSLHVSLRQLC